MQYLLPVLLLLLKGKHLRVQRHDIVPRQRIHQLLRCLLPDRDDLSVQIIRTGITIEDHRFILCRNTFLFILVRFLFHLFFRLLLSALMQLLLRFREIPRLFRHFFFLQKQLQRTDQQILRRHLRHHDLTGIHPSARQSTAGRQKYCHDGRHSRRSSYLFQSYPSQRLS